MSIVLSLVRLCAASIDPSNIAKLSQVMESSTMRRESLYLQMKLPERHGWSWNGL